MSPHVRGDVVEPPVEDFQHIYELTVDVARSHREARYSTTADFERRRTHGVLVAIRWLAGGEPVGPVTDGSADSAARVRQEADHARWSLGRCVDPAAGYAAELLGVTQVLEYAAGTADSFPGYTRTMAA